MKDQPVAENWNLISGGPSRKYIRPEHLLPGAVCTVNRAIDVVGQGIEVNYAAFADGPYLLWRDMDLQRFWSPGMILWINSGCAPMRVKTEKGDEAVVPGAPFAKLWDTQLDSCIGFRLMPSGTVAATGQEGKSRAAFTTLCAFKNILRYSPKKIRILSMDMAGSWVEGLSEETCLAKDMEQLGGLDRWKHERATMERHINQARADLGVVIELVTPEPVVEESLDGAIVH